MLLHLLLLYMGGTPAAAADNAERYIRPNPADTGTVTSRLRPVLPTD